MRLGFDKANFEQLAELWNSFYPPKFRIDAPTLRAQTVDSHLFDWGASVIEVGEDGPTAFVAIKKSAASLYRGPDPDQAHITAMAFRQPNVAVDLVSYVKKLLVNRGIYKLVFGQDALHFFPGCPADAAALRDFLVIEGFTEGPEQFDLEIDLSDYVPPAGALEKLGDYPGCKQVNEDLPVVRAIEPDQTDALREFLEREFPGRWRYDTFSKIAQEEQCGFVYGLWIEAKLEGYAVTQDWNHKHPIAGGVWRLDLGENWTTLGPIGVSKSIRGKGLGEALLAAALLGLRECGGRRCLIDWTTLVEFYGKHGFQPTRTYKTFVLQLHP